MRRTERALEVAVAQEPVAAALASVEHDEGFEILDGGDVREAVERRDARDDEPFEVLEAVECRQLLQSEGDG
ncbi:hypothetical protein ON010_g5048 [Phytophthora cinnamomi]|nr:hypothetical protein ON010_g5048 [Phytophthora cinnamomi]